MDAIVHSIKEQARRLGFDACGVAAVANEADDGFDQWLQAGCHADMAWLARTRDLRQQVTRKVPGAQSILVLAKSYYRRELHPAPEAARIARYAWRRDYHRALAKPLRHLVEHINSLCPEAACYGSTDSGPVRERVWAARAGLGWIGRNGLVIHPDMGSWFYLATIITTVSLTPDVPMANQCGPCTACRRACPTHAIIEDRTVDARRCIAYHTIENRNEIPDTVAHAMNGWVFGCDICQEVCPWNRPQRVTVESDAAARMEFATLTAQRLASLSEEEYARLFHGTPVARARYAGLKRNAALCLAHAHTCDTASLNGLPCRCKGDEAKGNPPSL